MKSVGIFFGIILAIVLSIAGYFSDNIKGYYKFKQYCLKEGGLVFHRPLKKNVGWIAKNRSEAQLVSTRDHIGFVRYPEENQWYDLKLIESQDLLSQKYEVAATNFSVEPIYKFEKEIFPSKFAFESSKTTYQIRMLSKDVVIIKYNTFRHLFFDPKKIPINQEYTCPNEVRPYYSSQLKIEINKLFED